MATHSIKLTRSAQEPHNVGSLQGYHFTVTASDGVNMPNEIFRMYERPLDPLAQTVTDTFAGVCSVAELQQLPVNAPIPPDDRFRVLFIDVFYRTVEHGDKVWAAIQADTDDLVKSLTAADRLNVEEQVVFTE